LFVSSPDETIIVWAGFLVFRHHGRRIAGAVDRARSSLDFFAGRDIFMLAHLLYSKLVRVA
jgi:hypothetical protein